MRDARQAALPATWPIANAPDHVDTVPAKDWATWLKRWSKCEGRAIAVNFAAVPRSGPKPTESGETNERRASGARLNDIASAMLFSEHLLHLFAQVCRRERGAWARSVGRNAALPNRSDQNTRRKRSFCYPSTHVAAEGKVMKILHFVFGRRRTTMSVCRCLQAG
jgi:hypothetical protein